MPGRVVGQQVGRVAGLDVLGEQQDARARVAAAELDGGPQALVGEGGRHADVDDGHVGQSRSIEPREGVGLAHRRR